MPEVTTDSGDKAEEATVNLRVSGKFTVTCRAHEQTFAYDIFFLFHIRTGAQVFQQMHLSHKIRENFLMYTSI